MKRRKQCAKCPWKKSTNPHDIPGGYCVEKHKNLKGTIAEPANLMDLGRTGMTMMACHETTGGNELPCVGWLAHQLGPGNNLALRMAAIHDKSLVRFDLEGEQHERFEDTLPE